MDVQKQIAWISYNISVMQTRGEHSITSKKFADVLYGWSLRVEGKKTIPRQKRAFHNGVLKRLVRHVRRPDKTEISESAFGNHAVSAFGKQAVLSNSHNISTIKKH